MTLILDYSFARPSPAAIKAAGYSGVMRYLSVDNPQTHGKIVTSAEVSALHAAGLSVGLVWEYTAGRAGGGTTAGLSDVRAAENAATALGYPRNLPIFYAVDYGADPSTVLPYFQGIQSLAVFPVGVYGSASVVSAVLSAGTAKYSWQTSAWTPPDEVLPNAHLYQRLHPTVTAPVAGGDEDVVVNAFPMWDAAVTPPVVVHPPASAIPPVFTRPPAFNALPILKVGSSGAAVKALQAALDHVFPAYSHLSVDGVFGPATDAVVKEFQRRSGLVADGVVGQNTRAALRKSGINV